MTDLKYKKGDIVFVIRKDDPEKLNYGWSEWNNVPLEIVEVDKNFRQWPYTLIHPVDNEKGIFAESELALA